MKILLTNDDGIQSYGLQILAKLLGKRHEVWVFAPNTQRSAASQALTVHTSIAYTEYNVEGAVKAYAIDGMPADCVKVALIHFDYHPDMIISGINKGANLGSDIMYSGTVGAAMEALLYTIKGIAVSQSGGINPDKCAHFIDDNIERLSKFSFDDCILNINYPDYEAAGLNGIVISKMGLTKYRDAYEERETENGKRYHLTGDPLIIPDHMEDSDVKLSQRGYITVTPIMYDRTHYGVMDELTDVFEGIE